MHLVEERRGSWVGLYNMIGVGIIQVNRLCSVNGYFTTNLHRFLIQRLHDICEAYKESRDTSFRQMKLRAQRYLCNLNGAHSDGEHYGDSEADHLERPRSHRTRWATAGHTNTHTSQLNMTKLGPNGRPSMIECLNPNSRRPIELLLGEDSINHNEESYHSESDNETLVDLRERSRPVCAIKKRYWTGCFACVTWRHRGREEVNERQQESTRVIGGDVETA